MADFEPSNPKSNKPQLLSGSTGTEEDPKLAANNPAQSVISTCISNDSQKSISDQATGECSEFLKDPVLEDGKDKNSLIRPGCSELVEAERRASTQSTGSEKLRCEKTKQSQPTNGKNHSEGQGKADDASDKYGSLALWSCGKQSKGGSNIIEQEDHQPKVSNFANQSDDMSKPERQKTTSDEEEFQKKIQSKQLFSQKSGLVLPSPWLIQISNQAHEVKFTLNQPVNLEKILEVLNLFVQDNQLEKVQSTNDALFTMRKKRKKGFLETFCLVLRQCLVFQLRLDQQAEYLTVVLVEGTVAEAKDYIEALEATLWVNQTVKLQPEECINSFILSQADEIDTIKRLVKGHQLQCQMDLHKSLRVILKHRNIVFNYLSEFADQFGRLYEVAQFQVDKTIFTKSRILKQYCRVNKSNEQQYQSKRSKILTKWSVQECFKYLEVDPKFQLPQQHGVPYKEAIEEFQRLNHYVTPNQKLKCLTRGYNLIQQCCLAYYEGEVSLDTMDSLLPVLIFVVLRSNIKDAYANIKLVEHFVEITIDNSGQQARIVTNVFLSMQYISASWALSH